MSQEQLISELLLCARGLFAKGMPPADNAIQSARLPGSNEIWIVPPVKSFIELEQIKCDKIDANNFVVTSNDHISEISLHVLMYNLRPDVNAIFHTMNPYTISAIVDGLLLVHGEAALILGDIPIIENEFVQKIRKGYKEYVNLVAKASIGEPLRPVRTIILKQNGVISMGACIHETRAFAEIIEEWARFKTIAKIYGPILNVLTLEQLRALGSRYARSIKFGGRQAPINHS
ncbi:MAG: class II aldolase/adducin family protein [Nitrososphaerales archaeon]